MPVTHELKTDPLPFDALARGVKTCEVRLNDRDFKVGDELLLKETRYTAASIAAGYPLTFTGRALRRAITHVQQGYGLAPGHAMLSLGPAGKVSPPLANRNRS